MLPSDYADMGAQAVHSCKYLKKLIANGTRSGNTRNHGRPARFSMADLSKRLDMTLAAVSYAVKRGEKIAKEAGCHLDD